MDWFVVKVKPRHEKAVSAMFEGRGLDSFLPLYLARNKWSDRIREVQLPLFPGYVFCRFDPHRRTPVLSVPGVSGIVQFGLDPAAVATEEIESLKCLMRSGLQIEPWPRVEIGELVEVNDGPLTGCKGVVVEIKKKLRLVLSVTLLHRSVLIELDREWVGRVSPRRFPLPSTSPLESGFALKKLA